MSSQFARGLAVISGLIGIAGPTYFVSTSCTMAATASTQPLFRMDALLAPIALLPDELLAKVLIASTYPLEVNEAAEWVAQSTQWRSPAFEGALQKQRWDASVKDLARVPVIMVKMNDDLAWTERLGNAFLSDPQDVMGRIQELRLKAKAAGFLNSTVQQTVSTEAGKIIIEPAFAQSLYVPYYDVRYVYGASGDQHWWAPPPGRAYQKGIAFLDRVALPAGFANARLDWEAGNLYVARKSNGVEAALWRHDPSHRCGVIYSTQELQDRFAPSVQSRTVENGDRALRLTRLSAPGGGLAGIGEGNEIRIVSQRGHSSLRGGPYQAPRRLALRGSST